MANNYSVNKISSNIDTIPLSLVLWHRFNSNVIVTGGIIQDSSELINNGSLPASLPSTYPVLDSNQGNYKTGNYALKFVRSSSQFLNLNTNITFYNIMNNNGISFAMWIKIPNITSPSPSSTGSRILDIGNGSTSYFNMQLNGNNLVFNINNNTGTNVGTFSVSSIIDDNWHHFVWNIAQNGKWTFYIDNVYTNPSVTATLPIETNTANTRYLGRSIEATPKYLTGIIDDFRIYNRTLTATEVDLIYNTTNATADLANMTGILAISKGGTGKTSLSNSKFLTTTASGALDDSISIPLPIAQGGTGASSLSNGVMLVSNNAISTIASLPVSSGGIGTTTLGSANGLVWYENATTKLNSFTLSANQIICTNSSSALTSLGALDVSRGGTGLTSIATNKILYTTAANTVGILGIGTGLSIVNTDLTSSVQLQSDWNQTTTTSANFIKNKQSAFNNQGGVSTAYTNINTGLPDYGFYYVKDFNNFPATSSGQNKGTAGETYVLNVGTGTDSTYPSTALQLAIPRNVTSSVDADAPYISIRYRHSTNWSSWYRIKAGYADSAGSCTGNAATATTAGSCTGNAATATSATTLSGNPTIAGNLTVNGSFTIADGQYINFGASGADGRIYRSNGQVNFDCDDNIYFNFSSGGRIEFTNGQIKEGNRGWLRDLYHPKNGNVSYADSAGYISWVNVGGKPDIYYNGEDQNLFYPSGISVNYIVPTYLHNRWRIIPGGEDNGTGDGGNLYFQAWKGSNGSRNWVNRLYFEDDWSSIGYNFTGQHRCISDNNTLYDKLYIGYILSTTGKYKNLNSKYKKQNIKYNINIDDALPYVNLSQKSYDKCVFGILTNNNYENKINNNRVYANGPLCSIISKDVGDERITINGCGEGSIWVSDYNGPLENGDYITTSAIPGIGMKQDDDLLHNYTVAKITMDCDFNPQYIPIEVIKQHEYNMTITSNITNTIKYFDKISSNMLSSNITSTIYIPSLATSNTLDQEGNLVYEYQRDANSNIIYDYEYDMKYIKLDGTIVDKIYYEANKDHTYRMAFVGCTYKCS